MKTIGVYEAKTQLPRLLVRVARGERITITRHGVPVATLVPAEIRPRRPIEHVVADLQAFARGRRLGGLSLRRLMESGRR
jgi:prevent-host-death family protein